jgi:putative transposase
MPDHVHLLVEGLAAGADLQEFIKRAKQGSAQAYSHRHHSPLWQEGFYDRVLRSEDDAKVIARYIVENPVRSGIVRTPSEYPYLGSDVWRLDELIGSL